MEFSLKGILSLLLKRSIIIFLCTLFGMGVFYSINKSNAHPTYTASSQLYVYAKVTTQTTDISELYYAQKAVNTYINILKTNVFFGKVIEKAGVSYTPGQLSACTSIKVVDNTEIFQISVTTSSAYESYKLVSAMQDVAPNYIRSIKNSTEISIVDPAVFNPVPTVPNILLNTILGAMLGCISCIGVIFLLEFLDVRVKSEDEITKKYQLPILGAIPNYNHAMKDKRFSFIKSFQMNEESKEQTEQIEVVNDQTKFLITEAYKALRTNLRYTLRNDGCKKIIINSPLPEEGKSTTSTNLGITIVQTGARVLLMDCDLRKGRLHHYFNLKHSPGITDVLSGVISEKDAIQATEYDNLYLLSMGSLPPNPTELLGSSQMEDLIRRVEKNFDYIIFDTPPVNVVSDVLSLIKLADGIVIVARENRTTHPNITKAITRYEFIDHKILGIVLNATAQYQGRRSKYYYHRYKDD